MKQPCSSLRWRGDIAWMRITQPRHEGDTDLRLCKFFGLSEGYFLGLQNAYDTLEAKRRVAEQVAKIKPYKPGKAA